MSHPPRIGCTCSPECRARRAQYEKERRYYAERGQPLTVPAIGFKRRVRALAALGWTQKDIAAELGIATGNMSNRMTYAKSVTRRMHDAMCDIYDRLSMTLPPDTMANRRTRTMAHRAGWLPPLALEDSRIDDPTYRPRARPLLIEQPRPRKPDHEAAECPRCGVRRQVRVGAKGELCGDCKSVESRAS